jgi:hypothetical protein
LEHFSKPRYPVNVAESEGSASRRAQYPEYSEDGVDVSQIRWMLSLTPAERLQLLESSIHDIRTLRELNG